MKSPTRILFEEWLESQRDYLKGLTLNVAGGGQSYRELTETMINVDISEFTPGGKPADIDVKADICERFPFKNNKFDSVMCTNVLEHIPDPNHVITEIGRVLKPGGYAVIAVPFLYPYHPHPKDFWRFTEDGLREALTDTDLFNIKEIVSIGNRYTLLLLLLHTSGIRGFGRLANILMKYRKHNINSDVQSRWPLLIGVIAERRGG